jgi:LacI family transcriptional regulator
MMASIRDVARLSGFSVTTVSRALNGYNDVNENTRNLIKEAARKLQYVPNIHAKNLVMKKSNRIGFIVFDFGMAAGEDNFVYELMVGMHHQCLKIGFELVFLLGSLLEENCSNVGALIRQYGLCGIVIMGCGKDSRTYQELLSIREPVVLIDGDIESEYVGSVSIDNYQAATEVMHYLIDRKKRKKILLINGKEDSFASLERFRGYRDALGDRYSPDDVHYAQYRETKSMDIVERLLSGDEFPYDAIFATSDMMAVGAQNALLKHNIRIGDEVDIVGFDNITLSGYIRVPLTTVSQDKVSLGKRSISMLTAIIRETSKNRKTIVKHQLVIRDSA